MELVLEGNKEAVLVRVIGELVAETCSDLREMVTDVAARQPEAILLDMSQTPFIDTSGLGVLVGLLHHLRIKGTSLRLIHPSPAVAQSLRLTRLSTVFGVAEPS